LIKRLLPGSELIHQSLTRARQQLWLRGVTRSGHGVVLEGRPFFGNAGSLILGDDVRISSRPVQSHIVIGKGARVEIGRGSVISFGAAISAWQEVTVGENTRLGPLCVIMDSDFHVVGDRNAHAPPAPIHIGSDVVIESRVTILRGSRIGNGARVRSGSVVSGDVAAGTTVAGVPASVLSEDGGSGEDDGDLRALVQSVLGLEQTPQLEDGPEQIPQWDSLGSLKLLLALERKYKVSIREDQLKSAHSIALLGRVVAAARAQ
jgi:acetyltransferase-like isoleucine patch superfamily enzyme/acyl carrier protein